MFNKTKTPTPTDELINYIILKVAEEPEEWICEKYHSKRWWYRYKNVGVFLNVNAPGLIQDCRGDILLTGKQRKKIAQATIDLRSNQALRNLMKASVENVE